MVQSWRQRGDEIKIDTPLLWGWAGKRSRCGEGRGGHEKKGQRMGPEGTSRQRFWSEEQKMRSAKRRGES